VKDDPSTWAASAIVASILLLVVLGVLALVVLVDPIP
jgi:hypothetical protein